MAKFPKTMLTTLKDLRKAAYSLLENGKDAVMKLYIELSRYQSDKRIILEGDHTAYPRMYAPTLKDRTYEFNKSSIIFSLNSSDNCRS